MTECPGVEEPVMNLPNVPYGCPDAPSGLEEKNDGDEPVLGPLCGCPDVQAVHV